MSKIAAFELTEVSVLPQGEGVTAPLEQVMLEQTLVELNVSLGDASLSIAELRELKENSIVKFSQQANSEFELKWKNMVVAKGRLISVDEQLALEITQVNSGE